MHYSIEQGLIGPKLRLLFGALLAAALIGAGEWARRQENLRGIGNLPSAHIPGILTAAGTTVAYAVVYAAYALYGFLNPGFAFILLGAVALATLAAALLHGPALAGLGLVGAYVTPLLVASTAPNYCVSNQSSKPGCAARAPFPVHFAGDSAKRPSLSGLASPPNG
jgi:uncharacterized membrane protein